MVAGVGRKGTLAAQAAFPEREVVALRLAIKDMATKDFIRAELRSLLEELDADREESRER